jgi:hypothetical protein
MRNTGWKHKYGRMKPSGLDAPPAGVELEEHDRRTKEGLARRELLLSPSRVAVGLMSPMTVGIGVIAYGAISRVINLTRVVR